MRFISLSEETVSMLTGIHKYSRYHRVRQRAHCILLSNEGRKIPELKKMFKADLITICTFSMRWSRKDLQVFINTSDSFLKFNY